VGSVSVLALLAAVGTWVYGVYNMSDPVPLKMAVCPTDVIRRVEVSDFDDDKSVNPKGLWWASNPTTPSAKNGVVKLWSGEGFGRHAPEPAQSALPRDLVVGTWTRQVAR
jgi:hypothetical protein